MKFKIRPSNTKKRLNAAGASRKKLRLRGATTLRAVKQKSLMRNYAAEDFGTFDTSSKKRSYKHYLIRLTQLLNNWRERYLAKQKRKGRVSLPTVLGIFTASVAILLIASIAVTSSFLINYNRSYTPISIPDLVSLDANEATALYNDIFEYDIVYKINPSHKSGTVSAQTPLPNVVRKLYNNGEKIKITLTVNTAEQSFTLPSLYGTPLREALILLHKQGINVNVIKEYSNTEPAGSITSCSLPEGAKVKSGESITLRSSLGKEKLLISVPNLWGLSENEAVELISSSSLRVGDITYTASSYPVGTVVAQSSASDTKLIEQSAISFTVSGGIYYED